MAEYQPENGTIRSPDFTDGASVNFESANGIVVDDEDYAVNFGALWQMSPELAEQYLQIIYIDTLCFNMDRHTKNYGVLRDTETGTVLRMAPNFDNNVALFARGIPENLERSNDRLVSLFCDLLERDDQALEIVRKFPVPNCDMINICAEQITIRIDRETLCAYVMNGSGRIQDHITNFQ